MSKINLLINCCILLTIISTNYVSSAPSSLVSNSLLSELAELDPVELAALEQAVSGEELEELSRLKRSGVSGHPGGSGSPDFFSIIKNKISQGIQSKLKTIGQASAHFSGGSSGGSSGGGGYHYDAPSSYDEKSFDWWALKKQILNTLFQAVKAIKGGVIAIKGQLIKGGGQLISTKGKIISAKGEAITNLGRHIASSALLSPAKPSASGYHSAPSAPSGHEVYPSHSSSGSSGYLTGPGPSSSYGTPSSPGPHYGAPSSPGPQYGAPSSVGSSPSGPSAHYSAPTAPSADYGAPSISSSASYSTSGGGSGGFGSYLPVKYNAAYEVKGKLPDGQESNGILIMKPIPNTDLNLKLHHTGTLTLVSPFNNNQPMEFNYDTDPRHKPLQVQELPYEHTGTTLFDDHKTEDKPVIPPFKHLPLKDQIPTGILQSILGGISGLSGPEKSPAQDSYGPPAAGVEHDQKEHSKDEFNLSPPVDQSNSYEAYSDGDKKPEATNYLVEDTSIFDNVKVHPDSGESLGPEPRPNFDIIPAYNIADFQLQGAQTQIEQQNYLGPVPPQLDTVQNIFDPMTYPVNIPAYQLYKQMGHVKDNTLDNHSSTLLNYHTVSGHTRAVRSKRTKRRKPVKTRIIYQKPKH